jgi:hypothetical protein
MTTPSAVIPSPALSAFIDAVSGDEKLQAVFTELFAQAGDEAGEAALIARATEAGAPISAEDIDVLRRLIVEGNKEKSISDEELDVIGGGTQDSNRKELSWDQLNLISFQMRPWQR